MVCVWVCERKRERERRLKGKTCYLTQEEAKDPAAGELVHESGHHDCNPEQQVRRGEGGDEDVRRPLKRGEYRVRQKRFCEWPAEMFRRIVCFSCVAEHFTT